MNKKEFLSLLKTQNPQVGKISSYQISIIYIKFLSQLDDQPERLSYCEMFTGENLLQPFTIMFDRRCAAPAAAGACGGRRRSARQVSAPFAWAHSNTDDPTANVKHRHSVSRFAFTFRFGASLGGSALLAEVCWPHKHVVHAAVLLLLLNGAPTSSVVNFCSLLFLVCNY